MTEFGSVDNSTCKRVPDLLKPGDLTLGQVVIKRVAVVELGVNNGSGDGGGCFGIEIWLLTGNRRVSGTRLLSVQAAWTPGFFHQQERHHCAIVWPTLQTFRLGRGFKVTPGEIDILSRYRSRCSVYWAFPSVFLSSIEALA